jgi:WD40 repeat protein
MRTSSPGLPSLATVERAALQGTLPALVAALERQGELSRWLARALRVELATILARPKLAFPCVYNRAFSPERAERSGFGGPARDAPSLDGMLAGWCAEHGAVPWARSLRPPRFPLTGALREEYRGDYRGTYDLSLDDAFVSARGHAAVTWDRERSVRVPVREDRPRVEAGWAIGRLPAADHWGRYRIIDRASGAVVLDARVNDDDSFQRFTVTPDRRWIITGGWCGDYEGVVCAFDRQSGALRWRAELTHQVDAVSVSTNGAVIAAFEAGWVTILDSATGGKIARAFVGAGSGALDATGRQLVTRTDHALRVWDVVSLAQDAEGLRDVASGWIDAAFSSDGRRVLTGAALCDAQSGRRIALLNVDGPGYLEGGPPEEARALGNDRFVELCPFGLRAWETEQGSLVVDDDAQGAGLRDAVRMSRDGRHYVRARRDWTRSTLGPLAVFSVDSGARVADIAATGVRTFEMSPDGAQLCTGHTDGIVRVFHLPGGALFSELRAGGAHAHAIAFSADGARLAVGDESGLLRQWDLATGQLVAERRVDDHDATVRISHGSLPCWSAGEKGVARLHGWEGFRSRLHPCRTRWEEGCLIVEHEGDAHASIVIPTDEDLVFDASGRRAAWRDVHVALEV